MNNWDNNPGYTIVKREDAQYPGILKEYERMPDLLYVKGNLPDPEVKSVAIVGARVCSMYGKNAALHTARILAENGVQIISGLALGIDQHAHQGALEGGGKTFAVMGCGIDICYPESNRPLYNNLLASGGGVLTEFEPGAPPLPHHFPIRNRIISALADAVIVIEARKKSGSLITASYALEQGKTIFALPGRVSDLLSEGCNELICQGAFPLLTPDQVLEELGIHSTVKEGVGTKTKQMTQEMKANELKLYQCVSDSPKTVDMLQKECELDYQAVIKCLVKFELNGLVEEPYPGSYCRTDR